MLTEHGVPIAPNTYYARKKAPISDADLADAYLVNEIVALYRENNELYGIRKMWHALRRRGRRVGRDQVGRLMRIAGIQGVRRGDHHSLAGGVAVSRPGPARLGQADQARHLVGGGLHLRLDADRSRLRLVHHRCLLAAHSGLAGGGVKDHRSGGLGTRSGAAHPAPARYGVHRHRVDTPFRRRIPGRNQSVVATP